MRLDEVPLTVFPDGHRHVAQLPPRDESNVLVASVKTFEDLFLIAQIKERRPYLTELRLNYLLASRYDRRFTNDDSLDLRIVANFINALRFERVTLLRPHSDVATALISNCEAVDITPMLIRSLSTNFNTSLYTIIAPDAGADKWVYKLFTSGQLGSDAFVNAVKHRDTSNGALGTPGLMATPRYTDCVIVDDLCDGGRTFITLAEVLKKDYGVKRVFLVVTHGIFSKGFDVFDGFIDGIQCTTSFGHFTNEKLAQVHV